MVDGQIFYGDKPVATPKKLFEGERVYYFPEEDEIVTFKCPFLPVGFYIRNRKDPLCHWAPITNKLFKTYAKNNCMFYIGEV